MALELAVAARVGRTLRGKYRLDQVLGVGGMAAVYAATHRNRKRFAVKVLHPEVCDDEVSRQRFLREGYAANSVAHPGAVVVLDDDVADDGSAFLVMELLEGKTLEDIWAARGGSLPVHSALWLVRQLLEVLEAAHARDILHRDLKPANLFLTRKGRLKVLDFGLARVLEPCLQRITAGDVPLGTPAFMAPEQALGKTGEIDARADLWAVGATLFTLISGELVHEGAGSQQLTARAQTEPTRSLGSVRPQLPRAVIELVDRALSFDRDERWPSARAMSQALEDAQLATFGVPLSGFLGEPSAAELCAGRGRSKPQLATRERSA